MAELSVAEIVAAIPVHKQETVQRRETMLGPYYRLVSVEDVITAFEDESIIEPLHPQLKWGSAHDGEPAYEENDSYFWLVAHVLYWRCNLREFVEPKRQAAFICKQDSVLQQRWMTVAMHAKVEATKRLVQACLEADLYPGIIEGSFHDSPEWWGDPVDVVDFSTAATWAESARNTVARLVRYSKSDRYKAEIARRFVNDPSEIIRRSIAAMIRSGKIPDPRG